MIMYFRILIVLLYFDYIWCQRRNTEISRDNNLLCKCMEYWECINSRGQPYSYCAFSNNVCCISEDGSNLASLKSQTHKTSNCGKKGYDSGREEFAEPGEWAWHIAILESSRDLYVCGGSLIDEFWVLTAAHCVDDYKTPQSLKVRVGEYDVSSIKEPETHEEYTVEHIILHPQFNNNTLQNDIALLKLNKRVKKRVNVNIICIPNETIAIGSDLLKSKCFITGWGRRTENSDHSLILKEVNVPIWDQKECQKILQKQFGGNYQLPKTALCSGAEGRDACDGDGGGGLFCEHNNTWYQIGIISFGIGCGRKDSPGVYTRVSSYSKWIYKNAVQ